MGNTNRKLKYQIEQINEFIKNQCFFRNNEWNDIGISIDAHELTITNNNLITDENKNMWTTSNMGVSQFKYLTQLKKITFNSCSYDNLDFLNCACYLKDITLTNMTNLNSINYLARCQRLEYVHIKGNCNIKNLAILSNCLNLRAIEIPDCSYLNKIGNMRIDVRLV